VIETISYKELTKERIDKLGTCYWGSPGSERFECSDIEDAVDYILDGAHPDVPDEVVVVAVCPRKLTAQDVGTRDILERTLEYLDEEYGDPDGDHSDPTPVMEEAALKLAEVIAHDYEVWICDEALRVVLDKDDIKNWEQEPHGDHTPRKEPEDGHPAE
jgi:hypothetical protein